jgi:predicted TIM-barrel fold metal-dependent hydrolase
MDALITSIRPQDVAREVEEMLQRGNVNRFVLRPVAHGGMLDQERLGATRYAPGVQAVVELEVPVAAQPR